MRSTLGNWRGAVWNNRPVTPGASQHDLFLVGCAAATVVLLLVLIARVRLHPALALAVGALGLGIASGMSLKQVPLSFTAGVGNLMGHIAIILGLGAILGNLLARSGGAASLGTALVDRCGPRGLPWALLALGIVVGMPVFFEVGVVLMLPIIAAAARRSGGQPIIVGLPLLAGLSIVHGTLPPHPAACWRLRSFTRTLGGRFCLG
jgi:GntP family gluconate:H+ symporter